MEAKTIKAKLDQRGTKHSWFAKKINISKTKLSLFFKGDRSLTDNEMANAEAVILKLDKGSN